MALRSSMDSSIVKTALSDSLGGFEFKGAPYGDYYVEFSHVSYPAYKTDVFTLNKARYTLPDIVLTNVITLGEAVVSYKKPLVERQIDRVVVNVDASPLVAGGSAAEVLDISPGVSVSRDGTISMAGKQGVQIFIDGKRTFLSGSDLAAFLDNLSAAELSQIEIMSNPPASYDAAGNAGIINIKTNKLKIKGYNGNVSFLYRQGRYPVLRQNTNFNYRNKKFNLFGNLSLNKLKTFDDFDIQRNIKDPTTLELLTVYDQTTDRVNTSRNVNGKLGFDVFLSSNTTIGVVGNAFLNRGEGTTDNTTALLSPSLVTETTILAPASDEIKWDNYNVNLNFRHNFDSTSHALLFDLDYLSYSKVFEQRIDNDFYNGSIENGEPPFLKEGIRNEFPQDINIYSAKLDYFQPLWNNKILLETGAKISRVKTDNDTKFFNLNSQGIWEVDTNLSNRFIYEETVNAAYLNFRYTINKTWGVQAGLRAEHTLADGESVTTNTSFNRDYLQFFPSFYLTHRFENRDLLTFNYGRRLERPVYASLNPFREFLDRYTYIEGNSNLNPQISNNFELGFSTLDDVLLFTAYYNHVDDIIQESIFQNSATNETFLRPENLASSNLYGLSMSGDAELADFWNIFLYLNYYNVETEGTLNELPFSIKGNVFSGRMVNSFRLGRDWSVDLGAWYTSNSIDGTFRVKPFGKIGLAIQKKILDNKGTIRFALNDPFVWDKFVATSNFQNIDISVDNRWQTQSFFVMFTYRFKKGLVNDKNKKDDSVDVEKDRIQVESPK